RRCNHRKRFSRPQRRTEKAGAPERAAGFVSPALFDSVKDRFEPAALENETGVGSMKTYSKWRDFAVRRYFEMISVSMDDIRPIHRQRDRSFMFAELHRRAKSEANQTVL